MAGTVAFLSARGVPVMGHVGLTPQAVNALGWYRSRGHAPGECDKIMRDGVAIAEAGAFSLVIEGVRPRDSGSQQTPCWREMDSNFQFRAR
jgi:3-methyl-2-oxobutanoate hydroxymethyltransferase